MCVLLFVVVVNVVAVFVELLAAVTFLVSAKLIIGLACIHRAHSS